MTLAVSVNGWLARPCLCGVTGSLPSIVGISIWAWELSKPSVPYHLLELSPSVALHPSFQHNLYSELAKKRHLGGNDGLSSKVHSSIVVISPNSGTQGLRARFVTMAGRGLCPSKASVEGDHRARSIVTARQGVPTLAKSGYVIV